MKRLLILILAGTGLAGCSNKTEIDASCLASLSCGAQAYMEKAEMLCKAGIENEAQTDLRWNHSRDMQMLSNYSWKDKSKGIIAYFGHKAEVLAPSGKYVAASYECDVNPKSKKKPLVNVILSTG